MRHPAHLVHPSHPAHPAHIDHLLRHGGQSPAHAAAVVEHLRSARAHQAHDLPHRDMNASIDPSSRPSGQRRLEHMLAHRPDGLVHHDDLHAGPRGVTAGTNILPQREMSPHQGLWDNGRSLPAPDRIIRVPGTASLAFGTTSTGFNVQWPTDGLCVAMHGTTIGDGSAAGLASMGVRITIGGSGTEIVFDGQAANFALFAGLFPSSAPWFPFMRDVRQVEPWTVFFRNESTATAFTPGLMFSFIARR